MAGEGRSAGGRDDIYKKNHRGMKATKKELRN